MLTGAHPSEPVAAVVALEICLWSVYSVASTQLSARSMSASSRSGWAVQPDIHAFSSFGASLCPVAHHMLTMFFHKISAKAVDGKGEAWRGRNESCAMQTREADSRYT